jgi:hypothetical protein
MLLLWQPRCRSLFCPRLQEQITNWQKMTCRCSDLVLECSGYFHSVNKHAKSITIDRFLSRSYWELSTFQSGLKSNSLRQYAVCTVSTFEMPGLMLCAPYASSDCHVSFESCTWHLLTFWKLSSALAGLIVGEFGCQLAGHTAHMLV